MRYRLRTLSGTFSMSVTYRLARFTAVVIAVVLWFSDTQVRTAEPPSGNDEALKIVEETYARNRAKFAAFTCKFQVIEGTSKSLEEAIAGRIDGKLIRNGLWVVSPDEMRYELDCPPGT